MAQKGAKWGSGSLGEGHTVLEQVVGNGGGRGGAAAAGLAVPPLPCSTPCPGLISAPFPSRSWSWPRPRTT